jgi:hypothetical protein
MHVYDVQAEEVLSQGTTKRDHSSAANDELKNALDTISMLF